MTVLELIAILSVIEDKTLPIILSSDEEGNSYRDLYSVSLDKQEFTEAWGGESVVHPDDVEGRDDLRDVVTLS